jgi:hypothetical protein
MGPRPRFGDSLTEPTPPSGEGPSSRVVQSENRALLTVALAIVVVTSVVGAYLLLTPSAPPDSLPVLAGTAFTANESLHWVAHFTVGAAGGALVGAWTAYDGSGFLGLDVVNGTVSKPPDVFLCPLILIHWSERNGTVNVPVAPGPHTVYWTAGYCSSAQQIVVTQTIEVVPA